MITTEKKILFLFTFFHKCVLYFYLLLEKKGFLNS